MKTLALTSLVSSVFALSLVTAPVNAENIFIAIDGEYVADNDVPRVNFDMSSSDYKSIDSDSILRSIDGEHVADNNVPRVNFDLSSSDLHSSVDTDAILRASDGEYVPDNY